MPPEATAEAHPTAEVDEPGIPRKLLLPVKPRRHLAACDAVGRIVGASGTASLAPGVVAVTLDDGAVRIGENGDRAEIVGVQYNGVVPVASDTRASRPSDRRH